MVVIKNGCYILLGHGTLKSAASQEWIDLKSWFFACWYNLGRGVKTLISGVLHKWFDELSRLIEWYLHADSDGIIFGLIAQYALYLWHLMLGFHCSCTC